MILTADSTVAHQTNRRKTGNGWHTTYIGKNRNTLQEGEAKDQHKQEDANEVRDQLVRTPAGLAHRV